MLKLSIMAGKTDSPLTNHGILQIQHLATHFRAAQIRFTHVFSSDLQRAVATAEGICETQQRVDQAPQMITTALLQERDFGSWEGVTFKRHTSLETTHRAGETITATGPAETELAMRGRVNTFLLQYFLPALRGAAADDDDDYQAIAIVAHGVILRVLWTCLVEALSPLDVHYRCSSSTLESAAAVNPHWSNTGYMELSIRPRVKDTSSSRGSIAVLSINNTTHLRDLRRTGGGIGSSAHDGRQRSIASYFTAARQAEK
ncbi:hypothetical protein UA08_03044 [Talaromyces atroroseus]|uniref:Phosphoglycerate mutase-like protein n=1 Tax=Talaromyces atroroseus TaxID=1441469 RepID=A0A225B3J4_TALAT|nr:hypothetical protein UA08_03044 [Talaromyces atroroseus]OKL61856.1 hypothetical protein UA08_03044 [Talaromyces atroroseus]